MERNRLFARETSLGLRLIFFVCFSVGLLFLQQHGKGLIQLRSYLASGIMPLQYTVHLPVQLYNLVHDRFVNQSQILHENLLLKQQQLILQSELQKLHALEQENNELRAILRVAPKVGERTLATQILAISASHFSKHLLIDKGASAGVFIGQPVVDAQGILGQIIEVSRMTSRVMLLIDPQSAIPVQIMRSGVRGIVVGNGRTLLLTHVLPNSDLRVGDLLMTSGLEKRFPAGYPVGVISRLNIDKKQAFMEVEVKPSAAMGNAQAALLVWSTLPVIKKITPLPVKIKAKK